jgi:hypothetical protein
MAWKEYISPREHTQAIKEKGMERWQQAIADGSYVKKSDYGRQWVYRNEEACWKNMEYLRVQMTLNQLRVSSKAIFNDERVKAIDPFVGQPIFIENSCRDGAVAYPYERRIRFGTAKNNCTMYHEIAHLLTPGDNHGREFCKVYVQLVSWFMGEGVAKALARNLGVYNF